MIERLPSAITAILFGSFVTLVLVFVNAVLFGHDPWSLPTPMVWAIVVTDAYAYYRLKDRTRSVVKVIRDDLRRHRGPWKRAH